jgi:hypothetical protein
MSKLLVFLLALELWPGTYLAFAQSAERDRSGYDSVGPFELSFTGARDEWGERTAQVREFLWAHWRNKVFARAAINYVSREGIPHPVSYFVERSPEGEWNVVIEAHRCPPNEKGTERRFVATVLQRIVARSNGSQPDVAIPDDAIVDARRFELLFKDSQGRIVDTL